MRSALALAGIALVVVAGCSNNDAGPSNRISLAINQCSVAPVDYGGLSYVLSAGEQFGQKDPEAERFTGSGVVEDHNDSWLLYQDDSGRKLVMHEVHGDQLEVAKAQFCYG